MISVCIATYNGARFIEEQISSILSQLNQEDEIVISDDSSTDETLSLIRSFHENRIKIMERNTFYNPVFNFENAIKQASGEIIVLSDQDDVWLDNRLSIVREKFKVIPHKYYTLVTDGYIVDEYCTSLGGTIFEKIKAGPGTLKNLFTNRYVGCCMAFSREVLDVALPFPRNIPMHDMWLGQLCHLIGVSEFCPTPVIKYRRHGNTQTGFKVKVKPISQLCRRLILAFHLLKRILQCRKILSR